MNHRHPYQRCQTPPPAALGGPHAELAGLTAVALSAAIRRRELSSEQAVAGLLERSAALGGRDGLNVWVTLDGELALAQARHLDAEAARGEWRGPLHGVPLAIKDALDTAGVPTTGGTAVLRDWVPAADATVVARLKAAGAIVLGKANLHEACFGITSRNPTFGAVRNPYGPGNIPGGSSGGTAAAVAAGLAPAGIGTDTGASVRLPAGLCGGVGLKPTVGRVPRGGMQGLSWTCDVIGPMTRDVADAELLLGVIAGGPDPRDPGCVANPVAALAHLAARPRESVLAGLRIGIVGGLFARDLHPDVVRVLDGVRGVLEGAGVRVVDVQVPEVDTMGGALLAVVLAETIVLMREYWQVAAPGVTLEGALDGFGPDVRGILGSQVGPGAQPVPGHAYLDALRRVRPQLRAGFARAFGQADLLLAPVAPAPAPTLDEHAQMRLNGELLDTFGTMVRHTGPISLAGLPAVALPAGMSAAGLPIGVQLVGPDWSEGALLRVAGGYEQVLS